MQVKKKPRNAAAKKIQKATPKEKRTKKEQTEQPLLKRVIFGEERPDLTELEAGSTTILDILAPTTVDTKSKDYIVVDGVYHILFNAVFWTLLQRSFRETPIPSYAGVIVSV